MQASIRTITAIFILVILGSPLWASSPGAVYLNSVEGSAEYLPATSQRWLPARANTALAEGDTVSATGGNAEVFLRDGSLLRISRGSRLKVLSVERSAIQLSLESGRAYVNFKGLKGYPLFLSTPSAQVDALERAVYRLDVGAGADTEISVFAGEVSIAQPKGKMQIIAGTRLIMRKDGKPPVYTRTRPADDWDKWNRMKDGDNAPPPSGENRSTPAVSPTYAVAETDSAGPVTVREYVYVTPAPAWGYSEYYYPWYGWYARPYWRGWGPRWGWGPGWRGHGGYRGYHGPWRGRPGPGRGPSPRHR